MTMTKEQKNKYQAFAVKCMKNDTPVKFGKGVYLAKHLIFGFAGAKKEECITVELADLNGCDSMITVGLEEFYNENYKEEPE